MLEFAAFPRMVRGTRNLLPLLCVLSLMLLSACGRGDEAEKPEIRPVRTVTIATRTVVERTGGAFITSDISIIRALTGPIRPARARISEVTNRAVVATARPILAERRTGIAEGAAVVARLALATRTVVVRAPPRM